ncbi:fluoride transporter [Saccharomycopsis crataegensis]|uniref:Fluoride transporter n=1 Tax=Saccharomycopsis crataegensis TaxID=43959 RepID=A0AAV5QNV1_9ASCO|nr:fluoride transporter [Saccharomycopsis crataegensis]
MNQSRLFLVFCFFSVLGTLTRLGVTLLSQYPGTYLAGIVWSNFTACFLMGTFVHSAKIWNLFLHQDNGTDEVLLEEIKGKSINRKKYHTKKDIYLFTGLTTGYCGSFSSFSSLILELFLLTANVDSTVYKFRNPAYGLLQFLSILITQLTMSYAGFKYGKQLILYVEEYWLPEYSFSQKAVNIYHILEIVIEGLGFAFMVVSLVLTIVEKTWRSWTFAFLFSPFACYLRYYLSKVLNNPQGDKSGMTFTKLDYLGTFAANIIATLVLAIVTLLSRGKTIHTSNHLITNVLDCHVLTAVANGFCGVLSTVSTFIVEVNTLKFDKSSWYVFVSIGGSFCLMVLILGSYNWRVGLLSEPVC